MCTSHSLNQSLYDFPGMSRKEAIFFDMFLHVLYSALLFLLRNPNLTYAYRFLDTVHIKHQSGPFLAQIKHSRIGQNRRFFKAEAELIHLENFIRNIIDFNLAFRAIQQPLEDIR
uniref:Uncharacterized protein n=1 Tax=Parascaris equorum TaxID=6256 RepID=A0A914S6P1_PAREQ